MSGRRPLFSGNRRSRHWRLLALAQQLDAETVRQVFTHSSWVSERGRSYERLEFLGDSVLSLAVTTELYRRFPGHSEGDLARLRAYVVSRATCAKVARALGLGGLLKEVGTGLDAAELDQLMTNQNVLADVTESLIGALYLTFGFDAVRPAVIEAFAEHIDYGEKSYVDFKTELQEQLAKMGTQVTYSLVGFSGPPHERSFTVEAVVDGEALGHGVGGNKKAAEQEAAAEALSQLARRETRRPRRAGASGPGSGEGKRARDRATTSGRPSAPDKEPAPPAEAPGAPADEAAASPVLGAPRAASADAAPETMPVDAAQSDQPVTPGEPQAAVDTREVDEAPRDEWTKPEAAAPAKTSRRRGTRRRSRPSQPAGEAADS